MLIELTVKEKQNLQMSLRDLEAFYGSLHANTQEEQESFEDILKEIAHLRSRLQDHSNNNSNSNNQEITKVNQIARTLRLVANVVEETNLTEEELIVIRVDEIGSVTIMVKEQEQQGKWTIERLGEHFHEPVEYDMLTKDKGYDKYILRVNVGDRRIRFVEMHKGGSKDER